MTDLEKIKEWVATYPGFDILGNFQVDYVDQALPGNAGIAPSGLVEVERRTDIVGNVTVTDQYNFGIYCVFEKADGDSEGAAVNADWVMGFQTWVQAQSAVGLAPVFGDVPNTERVTAQNGVLYETGEGAGTYMVQLSVLFTKKYEVKNQWLT